jgi:oligoendopeptidase F
MNLLKKAGVDLSTEHPFKSTINVFSETLKELSKMQDWKITL